MPSSDKWLRPPIIGNTTQMNNLVVLDDENAGKLWQYVVENPISSAFFGDYNKWCFSLQFYPYEINRNSPLYQFEVFTNKSDKILCRGIPTIEEDWGYILGQYKYPAITSYLDYEPFTKVEVWLPFYGFTELRIADIADKYIQFMLFVDYHSGAAQYVIGVTDNEQTYNNQPFTLTGLPTDARIIGTCVFQLGYTVPLGSTGLSDTIRNVALAGIKGAASLVTGGLINSITGGAQTSKTITTTTSKNAEGKQITAERESTTTTEHDSNYNTVEKVGTTIKMAQNVIESLNVRPIVERSNNTIINSSTCTSIVIVKRKVKPSVDITTQEFRHLYGLPVGNVKQINTVHGYTEISAINFEGTGFGNATNKELAMLEDMVSRGIILP